MAGLATTYPSMVFSDNVPFTEEVINAAMATIDARLRALEQFQPSWEDAVNSLVNIGLTQLNTALQPAYIAITNIANLGALFQATSSSELAVETGTKVFIIDNSSTIAFAPARWMVAMSDDATMAMGGLVISYDRNTGKLTMNVMEAFGTGSNAAWQLSPSCPPLLAAPVVSGGNVDAQPSSISIPYIYDGPTQETGYDAGVI